MLLYLQDAKKRIEEARRQTEQIEAEIDVLKKEQTRSDQFP
jgi:hypothetical protein